MLVIQDHYVSMPRLVGEVRKFLRVLARVPGDGGKQFDVPNMRQVQLLQASARADELLHKLVGGFREDTLRGVVLDDACTIVENGDPVP